MKKIPDSGTQWPSPASDGSTGFYGISVAAEMVGMSVQALRLYERPAPLEPARTGGGSRRQSDTAIARVLGLEADDADLNADNAGHCELSVDEMPLVEPSQPFAVGPSSFIHRSTAGRTALGSDTVPRMI